MWIQEIQFPLTELDFLIAAGWLSGILVVAKVSLSLDNLSFSTQRVVTKLNLFCTRIPAVSETQLITSRE